MSFYKTIPVGQGKFAKVDAGDYEFLSKRGWYVRKDGYANTSRGELMHRIIMSTPKGSVTDHINGDKLDNRRCNLRICSQSQNLFNQKAVRGGTSQHKGVHWHTKRKKWVAKIMVNKKLKHIGYFGSETEAAEAYNVAAITHHKEFARANVIL